MYSTFSNESACSVQPFSTSVLWVKYRAPRGKKLGQCSHRYLSTLPFATENSAFFPVGLICHRCTATPTVGVTSSIRATLTESPKYSRSQCRRIKAPRYSIRTSDCRRETATQQAVRHQAELSDIARADVPVLNTINHARTKHQITNPAQTPTIPHIVAKLKTLRATNVPANTTMALQNDPCEPKACKDFRMPVS